MRRTRPSPTATHTAIAEALPPPAVGRRVQLTLDVVFTITRGEPTDAELLAWVRAAIAREHTFRAGNIGFDAVAGTKPVHVRMARR